MKFNKKGLFGFGKKDRTPPTTRIPTPVTKRDRADSFLQSMENQKIPQNFEEINQRIVLLKQEMFNLQTDLVSENFMSILFSIYKGLSQMISKGYDIGNFASYSLLSGVCANPNTLYSDPKNRSLKKLSPIVGMLEKEIENYERRSGRRVA